MNHNILLTYLFSILYYFQIDLALWTIFLTNNKGFTIVDLGIFQAVLMISRLVFEVPSGVLSDKVGRVKTLTFSTLVLIFSNIFILLGQSRLTIIISFTLLGISTAFVSGTLEAFLYDSLKANSNEKKYKYIYSNVYFITMLSYCAAMLTGGFLAYIDMRLMYVGNIIVLIIALITCFIMLEPPISTYEPISTKKIISNSIFVIKTNKWLLYLIAFITITEAISNNSWHLSQKLLSSNGISNMQVSMEGIFTTLACGFAAKAGYFMEKKLGIMSSSIFIATIISLPLIILGFSNNIYIMLITLTFVSTSISFARPIYSSYINTEISSSFRATLLSIQSFIASILSLVFAALLGLTKNIGSSFVIIGSISIPIFIFILIKIKLTQKI